MPEGDEKDPLAVDELIRQAQEAQKRWRKPSNEPEEWESRGHGWPKHVSYRRG